LKPGYAPSTLQIKRSRSYQISGRARILFQLTIWAHVAGSEDML
jgi:hypothetical protein